MLEGVQRLSTLHCGGWASSRHDQALIVYLYCLFFGCVFNRFDEGYLAIHASNSKAMESVASIKLRKLIHLGGQRPTVWNVHNSEHPHRMSDHRWPF
jgi:hypothetical protein